MNAENDRISNESEQPTLTTVLSILGRYAIKHPIEFILLIWLFAFINGVSRSLVNHIF
jgi:hypothetical protein